MSRRSIRKPLGTVPPPRPATKLPPVRPVGKTPGGDPMAHAPLPHVARPPAERAAATPPNPKRPKLARDVHGGPLKDLFEIFPDLPRPSRPPRRAPVRAVVARRPYRRG